MRTYLLRFMGSVLIEAESADEASDKFNGEFGGDEILDAIDAQEIYGKDGQRVPWSVISGYVEIGASE